VIDADGDGVAAVCGLAADGIACATRGAPLALRSPWPAPDAPVWVADLDGDHRADWCAATSSGPGCGRAADRAASTDGASWGFSFGGVVEDSAAAGPTPDTSTAAIADVDGDGRADLCGIDGAAVTCALSEGFAFDPQFPLLALPAPPSALWLGDLDGDGRADACVDLGTTIACGISP
jgi:hypothetical protein